MQLFLMKLLAEFEFSIVEGVTQVKPVPRILLASVDGVKLRMTRRN
jgi:hypothetical protein